MKKKFADLNLLIKYIIYFSPLPIVINLFLNFYNQEFYFSLQNSPKQIELYNIFLSLFLFIFYVYIGKILQKFFKTKYVSTSIVIFWITLFSIDNIFLIFTKYLTFQEYVITMWVVLTLLILKFRSISEGIFVSFAATLLFLIYYVFFDQFANNLFLTFDQIYTSDEKKLWYPATKLIFEENYYTVLTNNPYPGYGLFTSYISALNSLFFNNLFGIFKYFPGVSYLFIYLFFYFIFEISKRLKTFLFIFILFGSIILTSNWFTYVFFGSLLSEVVSSYCFGVFVTELANRNNKYDHKLITIYLVIFGFLFYTRQFLSTLVIFYISYLIIKERKLIFSLGFIPMFIKILQSQFIPNVIADAYINENNITQIFFNFENISKMLLQFFIDKPISYLALLFILLSFSNLKFLKNNLEFYNLLLLNFILVLLLVVFLWNKQDDVQSTYRYLLNTFYLALFPFCNILDNFFKKNT